MTGARYIAEILNRYGVTHVFYMEAIMRRTMVEMEKHGITRVLTHSEKAASYMADGYARAANRPGVCMAQSVGAANLAAGLQDGFLGHSPVIAFTGRKPPLFQYRNAYQEILHNTMFDPVTKYNVEVGCVEQLPYLLLQAFREAVTGTPGPVHLDLLGNEGELTDEAEADLDIIAETEYSRCPPTRPVPRKEELEAAMKALLEAEKPVIVVGRGAVVSGAGPEITTLTEMLSIPVASSMDGKGAVPDGHPLLIGPVGTYCAPCANRVVSEADLVFFIGCGAGDQVTKNWSLPPVGAAVVQLDINPAEAGKNYPGTVPLVGDAKATVQKIVDSIRSVGTRRWSERALTLS